MVKPAFKKQKPFWRRSLTKAHKKSDRPSSDSGVASLHKPSSSTPLLPPAEAGDEVITNMNRTIGIIEPIHTEELSDYTEGNNSPDVNVTCREVGPFWSKEEYVSDVESSPKVTYNGQVIQETFCERMKDRLQDWRDRREKQKEKKERKRLAKLRRVKLRKTP
jgi:hypothetical protein